MKKIIILISLMTCLRLAGQVQIDMTTGVVNTISFPSFDLVDQRWSVNFSNTVNTNYIPAFVVSNPISVWGTDACGKWITRLKTGSGFSQAPSQMAPTGYNRYRMNFNASCIDYGKSAKIYYSKLGVDNWIQSITVNGNSINFATATFANNWTTLAGNGFITVPASFLVNGSNTIEVNTFNSENFSGFFFCGYFEYFQDYISNLAINSNTSYCSPDLIGVNGSVTGNIKSYFWKIDECTQQGVIVNGGYSFTGTSTNDPNPNSLSYTFPLTLPCNKYYKVTLTATGNCNTLTSSKVIFISCNNPLFTLMPNTSNSGYYSLAATPIETGPFNSNYNFGYAWYVEELNISNNSQVFVINNPSNWWTFTTNFIGFVNNFSGVNCLLTGNYTGVVPTPLPSNPSIGQFRYGRKYRITRGTWINNLNGSTLCPYASASQTIMISPPGEGRMSSTLDPIEIGKVETPDYILSDISELALKNESKARTDNSSFILYPTINDGVFKIETQNGYSAIHKIEILNTMGEVVHMQNIFGDESLQVQRIDISSLKKGIYFVRINNKESGKIILR